MHEDSSDQLHFKFVHNLIFLIIVYYYTEEQQQRMEWNHSLMNDQISR